MNPLNSEPESQLPVRLTQIADQLRALSSTGLQFTDDPYQIERYHTIVGLAAQLLSEVEKRPLPEIERIFFDDLDLKTPLSVVDTAVFDESDRLLLIQRADNGLWAMPGGACDVGEAPASGGAREVWEETGYVCSIRGLIGVFDSRLCNQRSSRHLYHFLFAGRVTDGAPRTTLETLDVRWFSPAHIPWDSMSPGHTARIRHALAWQQDPTLTPFFDDEGWSPPPDSLHHSNE